jgi:hypothetical protein
MAFAGTNPIVAGLVGGNQEVADQGNAYVAITPTPGTGIIGFATSTTLAIGEVNPDFVVYNPGPNTIYPIYLRVRISAVSTSSATCKYTQFMDQGNNVSTFATLLTKNNTNPTSPNISQAVIAVGANVRTLANNGSLRIVCHQQLRGTIDVVHDTYGFFWGTPDIGCSQSIVATVMEIDKCYQAMAIPPGWLFGLTHWDGAQAAAPTAEYEFGYVEK